MVDVSQEQPKKLGTPAGKVLAWGLLGLLLASLLNSKILLKEAQSKPLGTDRTLSIALWTPIEKVAGSLGLTRPQELIDGLLDGEKTDQPLDEDFESLAIEESIVYSKWPNTEKVDSNISSSEQIAVFDAADNLSEDPEVSFGPSPSSPLKLWILGDSMVQFFGKTLVGYAESSDVIEAESESVLSSGLVRPDFYDWPTRVTEIMLDEDPDVVVMMFGGNDGQSMFVPPAAWYETFSNEWIEEYSQRVGQIMDLVAKGSNRIVMWVAQPPMKSEAFDDKMKRLNLIYEKEALKREQVYFVKISKLFSDQNGEYSKYLTSDDGLTVDARLSDGVHLSAFGGQRLSRYLMNELEEIVDLSGGLETP
jgi:hypothetical protein